MEGFNIDIGIRAALAGGISNFEFLSLLDAVGGDVLATLKIPEKNLISLLGKARAVRWLNIDEQAIGKEKERCDKIGIDLLSIVDESFPKELANLAEAPLMLYVMGNGQFDFSKSVSIIGSRRCSCYGKDNARTIASDIAKQSGIVFSGLARGIDTSAHRGALDVNGATIAVMGRGLAQIYPAENKYLAKEIVESDCGLLVSEYPLDAPPLAYHFPKRNRLISALSRAVVVIEGGMRSGTLSTVNWALDQGRDVFALPGPVDMPGSELAHHLIRDGAILLRNATDIIDNFSDWDLHDICEEKLNLPDDKLGKTICNLLNNKSMQLEEILTYCQDNRADILARLTLLEIDKLVRKEAGNNYRLDSRLKS